MSVQKLHATRRAMAITVVALALVRALATMLCVSAAGLLLNGRVPVIPATTAASIVLVLSFWRARAVLRLEHVALWLEERVPALAYAAVTLAGDPGSRAAQLEQVLAATNVAGPARRALGGALARGLGVLTLSLVALAVAVALPRGALRASVKTLIPAAPLAPDALGDLRVRVTPPAYTGRDARTLRDPSTIETWPGATLVLSGARASEVSVVRGVDTIPVTYIGESWQATLRMPLEPAALHVSGAEAERVLVLAPVTDTDPAVRLMLPARDTTYAEARGTVRLHAEVADDIALASGYFEVLVSSGSGEIYASRTFALDRKTLAGESAELRATLALDELGLRSGDHIAVRAIAADGNTITGPGRGVSETRVLRIALRDAVDPPAVEGAPPPPVDSALLSQRMLIVRTEQLNARRDTMVRDTFVLRATDLAMAQDRLRLRVEEIIQLYRVEAEGGGLPRLVDFLQIAYDAMWAAVRDLNVAETVAALDPMRVALAALDSARRAERLYLRANPPRILVDVERVRLMGREHGMPSERDTRSAVRPARHHAAEAFEEVLDAIETRPDEAVRALNRLRAESMRELPAFAAALGAAVDAIRRERDATDALVEARRALFPQPAVAPGLPAWRGPW